MSIILNPGSENIGGTFAQAEINAKRWLASIHRQGFKEVEMSFEGQHPTGNFGFLFTHKITKKTAYLLIHGFTDEEIKSFLFQPREYWQGSSTAEPKAEDWLADGFEYRVVYEQKQES